MFVIVPANFGTAPSASVPQHNLLRAEPTLPKSVESASRLAVMAAKLLLATAFLVGLVSTIAAST
jgi:hypothetical protein